MIKSRIKGKEGYLPGKDIEKDFLCECLKLNIHGGSWDCHYNAWYIHKKLKDLGYDVKLCSGYYVKHQKVISHSWIEWKDKILETDCRQLREGKGDVMPDEHWAILSKKELVYRYERKEF